MDSITVDGTPCLLGLPTGSGPWPAMVVVQEALGLTQDLIRMSERFVDAGYVTLTPALFRNGFKPLCIARTVLDVFTADATATAGRVERMREWLAQRDDVANGRIGVIGFCMGGAVAIMAAGQGQFDAASVNYGKVPKDTSSLEQSCPVIGSYGGNDKALLDDAERLRKSLEAFGVPHDVTVYEGAGHSFLGRSIPAVIGNRVASIGYAPEQAAEAWPKIFAFFDQHLA